MEETRLRVIRALAVAGCVAPAEETEELLRAAGAGVGALDELVARRQRGEPLAWVIGSVEFCGVRVRVDRGVFVPRAHTEVLARRAASLLPADGVGVDLCTGSGAVAAIMRSTRPDATVLATDCDDVAIACARSNGVTAFMGDLDDPLPSSLEGRIDVMTAVVPYVPTEKMHLLPRDVVAYEPHHALDGGPRGTALLERVAKLSVRWLCPGGRVLLEIGDDQARILSIALSHAVLSNSRVYRDADGHDRAIEAWRESTSSAAAPR